MRSVICLLSVLALVGTVCVTSYGTVNTNHIGSVVNGTANGGTISSFWDLSLLPWLAAHNSIDAALFFQGEADTLYDQAVAQGLDVSAIDDLLAEADALLAEAQACFEEGDFSCAVYKALDAVNLYKDAISKLAALLGVPLPY